MNGKTILVIEDDDATRLGFGLILREHGYTVEFASCGKEGLDYLQNHSPPDLIILDMLMNGMDGWQFLKHRDARWPAVVVIITTALGIANDEWPRSLGACGCLLKPITTEDLLEKVGKCLNPSPE